MNIFDFNKRFPTEASAIDYIISIKYPDGFYCPKCGCYEKVYHQHYDHRKLYCNNCNSEFSALSGTIFENTHLDIRQWLYAINLILVARKGISALQLRRELGMSSYKGAWRMLHKIREAMAKESLSKFEVVVEIDETYVGGKPRKGNKDKKDKQKRGRGTSKTPVVGVIERNSKNVHAVVAHINKEGKQLSGIQLLKILNECCSPNVTVMTDQFRGYNILNRPTNKFNRIMIDHSAMFSNGNGEHTNTIESFWAILKRGVYGIYHNISNKHLQKYVDEFCFRINNRNTITAFDKIIELGVK